MRLILHSTCKPLRGNRSRRVVCVSTTCDRFAAYALSSVCRADESIRFPDNLHLDHPSLEQISIKRVKSVEKGCVFPTMGMIFIRGQLFEEYVSTFCKAQCEENSGIFECVQIIRQQPNIHNVRTCTNKRQICSDGYLIFVYKTMEDMCTKNFAASWKTWTGARLLCQLLPDKYNVKRLSFFKKITGPTQFAYVLIAQIADLMMDCAPALNVLHCLRPKICAFVGAYRIVTFKDIAYTLCSVCSFSVDAALCSALNIDEDQRMYAYASSLKVNYSNHTAFASYPGYNEFRCEDNKELESVSKKSSGGRKSSETQTDIVEKPMTRRTLPRTISIYDFPSMKNSVSITHKECPAELPVTPYVVSPEKQEKTSHDKSPAASREPIQDKKGSPIPVALVHPLASSPTGIWVRKKPTRKFGSVVFDNKSLCSPKRMESSRKNSREPDQKETLEKLILELMEDPLYDTKSDEQQKPRRAHSEVRTSVELRQLELSEDNLLQRLKLKYFNSPDYTSDELRAADSE